MRKIVVEFEKIRELNCGLGQVCLHLGKKLSSKSNDIIFYMPQDCYNLFPSHKQFISSNKLHRKISFLAPRADLWHCIHQDSPYFPRNSDAKVILTIHDLNFLHDNRSDSYTQKRLKNVQQKIDRADALTFVSEFTKIEVEKNLNTENKIKKVIYNGIALQKDQKEKKPYNIPDGKFLFSIGTVVAKKNFHVLVDFLNELPGYNFILAGWKDNPYANEMLLSIEKLGLSNRFILTGKVSEEEKNWLYQNCSAFVFPSLQEGFGLPVIEAMAFGKPVFLSKATSLPEVGGELAFYFSSFDAKSMVDSFKEGMNTFNNDEHYSSKLRHHSEKFSWDKASEQYLALYESLLTN